MALAVLQIEADFVINSNLLLVFDLACFELIFIDDLFADGARKTIGCFFKTCVHILKCRRMQWKQ